MSSSMISGCGGLTLGPTTKVEYVVVYPGQPLQVMENETVKVRSLEDDSIGRQDIGGWIAMPRQHYEELFRRLGAVPK